MKFDIASKSFGSKQVLGSLSLELAAGSITILMGPSGSGKTTLLRIIAGLDRDDPGTAPHSHKIGMVFQEPHLLPWKTALQNVELAGPENGLLASLGLDDAATLYPRQLSLGMARRVAFARAVASNPDLLLLDEPFASLDEALVQSMQMRITDYARKSGIPVLIATHNRQDALALNAAILRLEGSPAILRPISAHEA